VINYKGGKDGFAASGISMYPKDSRFAMLVFHPSSKRFLIENPVASTRYPTITEKVIVTIRGFVYGQVVLKVELWTRLGVFRSIFKVFV
jgi:hypothetical protein